MKGLHQRMEELLEDYRYVQRDYCGEICHIPFSYCLHCYLLDWFSINPQRIYARKPTILVLSVCLSVTMISAAYLLLPQKQYAIGSLCHIFR